MKKSSRRVRFEQTRRRAVSLFLTARQSDRRAVVGKAQAADAADKGYIIQFHKFSVRIIRALNYVFYCIRST